MSGAEDTLSRKLNILVNRSFDGRENEICDLLHDINSLSVSEIDSLSFTTRSEIFACITAIPPTSGLIVEKSLRLIYRLLTTSKNFSLPSVFKQIVKWLEDALNKGYIRDNILLVIEILFETHPDFIHKFFDSFFQPNKSAILNCSDDIYENLKDISKSRHLLKIILELLVVFLNNETSFQNTASCYLKQNTLTTIADQLLRFQFTENILQVECDFILVFYTIHLLSKVVTFYPDYALHRIADLLGLVKAYMQFNYREGKGHEVGKLPRMPTFLNTALDEALEASGREPLKKSAKTPKPRVLSKNLKLMGLTANLLPYKDVNLPESSTSNKFAVKTTDFDFHFKCQNYCDSRIRLSALSLLETLVKMLPINVFYGYWCDFFPINQNYRDGVLYCAISDSNTLCRDAALQIATQMIYEARKFLEQAETSERKPTSYMPFSLTLGNVVLTMYETLTQAVVNETSTNILASALKCLAVLIQATPFNRMSSSFIYGIINQVKKLITHVDPSIQLSALMVMESLVSSSKANVEILRALEIPVEASGIKVVQNREREEEVAASLQRNYTVQDTWPSFNFSKVNDMVYENWLLIIVLQKLEKQEIYASVKIKSLQVISSLSAHFPILVSKLHLVALALQSAVLDNLAEVRLYASRCLDTVAYNMNKYLNNTSSNSLSNELLACKNFWLSMLPIAIEKIGDPVQTCPFKVGLCDFLSNIGNNIFDLLPPSIQRNLLTYLSGIGSNTQEDIQLQATAARALSVFLLFPSLKEDLVLLENVAEMTMILVTNSNLHVRIKSVWSIGNVSDALLSNFEAAGKECISDTTISRLILVCIESCKDNDKVRCNSVRALGNLMHLITKEMLDKLFYRKLIEKGVKKLMDCIKASANAKVKWNACYAIGCIMKNISLFKAVSVYKNFYWHVPLFPLLCQLMVHNENFKVRINATTAIFNVTERSFFAEHFEACWCSLLSALEKSCELTNYLEYNHRDKLQERLCIALNHLICISSDNDCLVMRKELVGKVEIVKEIWFRVVNRMTAESAAPLLSCPALLTNRLSLEIRPSGELKNAICFLVNTFTILK